MFLVRHLSIARTLQDVLYRCFRILSHSHLCLSTPKLRSKNLRMTNDRWFLELLTEYLFQTYHDMEYHQHFRVAIHKCLHIFPLPDLEFSIAFEMIVFYAKYKMLQFKHI